jgi:chromosomal replication initiator protein
MKDKEVINPYVIVGLKRIDWPLSIKVNIKKRKYKYNQEMIIEAVEKYTDIKYSEFVKKTRTRRLSEARKLYCYFMRTRLKWELKEIGETLSGRDHTTVIHNINVYKDLYETDDEFRLKANNIAEELEAKSITI